LKNFILIISILFISGCDYTEKNTKTTNLNTDNGLKVKIERGNETEIDVAGKTVKANKQYSVESDGTVAGTNFDFDFGLDSNLLNSPTAQKIMGKIKDTSSLVKEEGNRLSKIVVDKVGPHIKSTTKIIEDKIREL